jgi:hypothetical protein
VSTPDGRSGSGAVQVTEVNEVTISIGGFSKPGLTVISPNGGEVMQRNSSYMISWLLPPSTGQYSVGNSFDVFAVHKTVAGDFVGNVRYTLGRAFLDFGMASGSFNWTVGQNQEGMTMSDGGNYYVQICYAGTTTCDESNAPFTLNSVNFPAPQIYSLSPSAGYPGTTITLNGVGFTPTNNIVHFEGNGGGAYIPGIASANGTTLTFQAPDSTSLACYYATPQCLVASMPLSAGTYRVWIENSNGASNQAQFTLQSNSYGQSSPQINSITPQSATYGTQITLAGSGFAATNNKVVLTRNDGLKYETSGAASSNGTALAFSLNSQMSYYCKVDFVNCVPNMFTFSPGVYAVSVENSNGASNSVSLQVY